MFDCCFNLPSPCFVHNGGWQAIDDALSEMIVAEVAMMSMLMSVTNTAMVLTIIVVATSSSWSWHNKQQSSSCKSFYKIQMSAVFLKHSWLVWLFWMVTHHDGSTQWWQHTTMAMATHDNGNFNGNDTQSYWWQWHWCWWQLDTQRWHWQHMLMELTTKGCPLDEWALGRRLGHFYWSGVCGVWTKIVLITQNWVCGSDYKKYGINPKISWSWHAQGWK